MTTGHFVSFYLPYSKGGVAVPSRNQAEEILTTAADLISKGAKGVAITYSANYGQTREIGKIYAAGGWNTHTDGAHQAEVMQDMESLLGTTYQALQGKMRIAPITTMNAYVDPLTPWNDTVLMDVVTADLGRIKGYLDDGWSVLGWQNQDTVDKPKRPYAVGGASPRCPKPCRTRSRPR